MGDQNSKLGAAVYFLHPASYISFVDILAGFIVALPLTQWTTNLPKLAAVFGSFNGLFYPGIYILNDLIDLPEDRKHPEKSSRPLASGQVSPETGLALGISGILAGMISAYFIEPALLFFEIAFLIINLLYSVKLKHLPYLDLLFSTSTHALRPVMAIFIFDQLELSQWPVVVTVTVVWLGYNVLKRHRELMEVGSHLRDSLKEYSARGLMIGAYFCLALLIFTSVMTNDLPQQVIAGLGSSYYILLLAIYKWGRGTLREFVDYTLTN